jgi:hypothetical protein
MRLVAMARPLISVEMVIRTGIRATAEFLILRILDSPPLANGVWSRDESDVVLPGWEGRTVIDVERARECPANEWLLVVAWDES